MKKLSLIIAFFLLFKGINAQTTLDTAVNFSGKDINGVIHDLFDLLDAGKYVLLDFFTTSCGPCVTYAPEIQQAYVQYGSNQQNVFFLGINYGDDNIGVSAFDSLYGITFPTISGLDGHGNTIALQIFDVQSFPTLVLVAPNRLILSQQIYPPSFNNIDSTISAALATTTVSELPSNSTHGLRIAGLQPNPVTDHALIEIETLAGTIVSINVLSVTGSRVFEQEALRLSEGRHSIRIPAAHLERGIYFVQVITPDEPAALIKFIRN
ncbi:MAG TPA: redoxin domain-containing protein [Bacteroidales bacterium]|nr:redoxin domain-containing protein [Bacteroidales bacterium]HSA42826.1 redoxin domain-containing protein [Bacteroidales bacterium]